jgi:hypothetical protein
MMTFNILQLNEKPVAQDDESGHLPAPWRVILSRLDQFIELLRNPPSQRQPLHLTFGILDPPLGEIRLKLVEFLCQLYHIGYAPVEKELIKHNVLSVIFVSNDTIIISVVSTNNFSTYNRTYFSNMNSTIYFITLY